jgi:predicted CXXCH cytochrome family protein
MTSNFRKGLLPDGLARSLARVEAGFLLRMVIAGIIAWASPAEAVTSIANTKHNLTPTGPGTFKAPEATGLCVFCHTPHNALPQTPLWNRALSGATYTLYTSSTLKAQVQQPTGSSRLCLSCHDGTLAMGTLRAPQNGVQPTLGVLTGKAVIGTDLSGDHPISFVYDSALAATRGELVDPLGASKALHLDPKGELQCASCHDAHDDRQPNFLRMDTRAGALCTTCHKPNGWTSTVHASSLATWNGTGTSPWPISSLYPTVADNACASCHRTHAAGHGKALLAQGSETANCTVCHAGTVATRNIQMEFTKSSHHPIENAEWTHTPNEDAATMTRHVACADCHDAHAADATTATVPNVSGPLKGVRGVNQSGGPVATASFEQEVCYKCHGLSSATTTGIQRQDNIRNARLQFDPLNPSFHPVAAVGKNLAIQNLVPGYTASSLIGCISCHNNDAWTSGGTNPAGSHGSNYKPILEREYRTDSTVVESPQNFALCYKCHDRNALTNPSPGKFPHALHLTNPANSASCAACHDPHGSRQQPHLINFMFFDQYGTAVVTPRPATPSTPPSYAQVGLGGQCALMCHGKDHGPLSY